MTEPAHPARPKTAKGAAHAKADGGAPNGKPRSHHRKVPAADGAGHRPASSEPLEGEVLRPRISPKTWRVFGNATRWIEGMLPAADGGPAPVMAAARVRFAGWIWAGVGLVFGCLVGVLVLLLATGVPGIPGILVGLSVGAILGAAVALVMASRFPMVRKAGGVALLAAPLLILAAPFLLLAGGIALLMRFPGRKAGGRKAS